MCLLISSAFSCGHLNVYPIPLYCKDEAHPCPAPWSEYASPTTACCEGCELERENLRNEEAWQALRQKYDIIEPDGEEWEGEDGGGEREVERFVGVASHETGDRKVEDLLERCRISDGGGKTVQGSAVDGCVKRNNDMEGSKQTEQMHAENDFAIEELRDEFEKLRAVAGVPKSFLQQ